MLHLALLASLAFANPQVTPPPTPPPLTAPSPEISSTPSPSPSPGATATPGPPAALTVSPSSLNLNPAQQREIEVTGVTPPLKATLDRKLVTATVDPSSTKVTVTASQAVGSDMLHLVDDYGATADVPIRVAFNAGTIVPQTTLKITGNPADAEWLGQQINALVSHLTQSQAGTQTTIGTAALASPLPPGAQTQVPIPIEIRSPDGTYFDVSGTTQVTVQNVALDAFAPPLLFYDDDPEHVNGDGVLFRGTVNASQPARLYYYHDNAGDPRRLLVTLTTASQDPTSVQLISGTAGPNEDVLTVGNALTRQFLLRKTQNEGTVVDLDPNGPYALTDLTMTAKQLVAGTVDVRVLSGGPVVVTVVAVSPGVDPRTLLDAPPLAGDGHHRTGVFTLSGFGNDVLTYTAGGADAKLVIGDRDPTVPSVDPSAPGHDFGDYGVLHTIVATLTNDTAAPADAYLYVRPIAGVDRATFLVDGTLVQIGCVRNPVPYQIAAYQLAPGKTYRATLQTMTDGGSFYPIEIGVTATPPQPQAPPIFAPDGCFPKPGAVPETSPAPGV